MPVSATTCSSVVGGAEECVWGKESRQPRHSPAKAGLAVERHVSHVKHQKSLVGKSTSDHVGPCTDDTDRVLVAGAAPELREHLRRRLASLEGNSNAVAAAEVLRDAHGDKRGCNRRVFRTSLVRSPSASSASSECSSHVPASQTTMRRARKGEERDFVIHDEDDDEDEEEPLDYLMLGVASKLPSADATMLMERLRRNERRRTRLERELREARGAEQPSGLRQRRRRVCHNNPQDPEEEREQATLVALVPSAPVVADAPSIEIESTVVTEATGSFVEHERPPDGRAGEKLTRVFSEGKEAPVGEVPAAIAGLKATSFDWASFVTMARRLTLALLAAALVLVAFGGVAHVQRMYGLAARANATEEFSSEVEGRARSRALELAMKQAVRQQMRQAMEVTAERLAAQTGVGVVASSAPTQATIDDTPAQMTLVQAAAVGVAQRQAAIRARIEALEETGYKVLLQPPEELLVLDTAQ
eukprot:TRINITY_DN17456_c0_g1_i1.p1 TRINITY_DN17456_c0_g1~~TRINITY_DN17456_c0_g1_i1.p1  ORF type:complete len:474 (+),score=76.59 TRINITY_DN17456_c0_g1_i1:99-1520(+)